MIGRVGEGPTERMIEAGTMKEGKMIGKKVHQIYDVWEMMREVERGR